MVTGDAFETASRIAKQLGIEEVHARILPEDKYRIIERMQSQGHRIAMAGDGINDAPALAQADVGIAMGTGTDVAIENASITLMQGDIRAIAKAHALSQATMRNIRTNLAFAFLYNVLSIPIATGAFYPLFGLVLNPMIASAAMILSSLCVIINSLRLNYTKF
jgi:Cu+-exporting ATPase